MWRSIASSGCVHLTLLLFVTTFLYVQQEQYKQQQQKAKCKYAKLIASLPKVLHFCAHSPKAYGSLEEILVAYAQESNYDTRLMSLISELVAKVHQIAAKQGGKFETGLSQEKFSYD